MPRPPRVLHVAQPTEAGVPRIALDIALTQLRRGWDVRVACPAGSLIWDARPPDLEVLRWDARRQPGPSTAGEVARLRRLVREARPDLVHLHSAKAGLAGRLALRGRLPTLFQPNAWSFEAVTGLLREAAVRWERLGGRWVDCLVCVSEEEQAAGRDAGVRARSVVIPNGVDLDRFAYAAPEQAARARRALGLADVPTVVGVGRLAPQKGFDVLLEAWPAVVASCPRAQLVLVGEGPERAVLEGRGIPSVHLVGLQQAVPEWLAAADVVAMPSRWEGGPLVALEAMATGRAVVASAVAGVRAALDGGAGAVVEVGDAGALAREVIRRLREPELARREGEAGRRRVEAEYDVGVTTGRIADLTEDVLAARSAVPMHD